MTDDTFDPFDVIFIGGGPGGYIGAIKAAQLGLNTACVEMRGTLGGTCLNVGCIPSKALLQSSHLYHEAEADFAAHGIKTSGLALDLKAMMARKDTVVKDLTTGIAGLFKKNKVTYIPGRGRVTDAGTVQVTLADGGERTLKTENIVIATGSDVMGLPGVEIDEKTIVSSTGALTLNKVPKHLVVIGGGYIGLEMGSVWGRLGAKVTVVEFLDRITPGMDGELSRHLQRALTAQGMEFRLGTKVTGVKKAKSGVELTVEPAKGGDAETLKANVVLVSIGRKPYTDGLGLAEVGVTMDDRGFIPVDEDYQTNVAGIFAIGDILPDRPMLAHKAEEEGVVVAEKIAGHVGTVNYDAIPGVCYTWPEVATVGQSEDDLKAAGTPYNKGRFAFAANSRARASGDTEGGFVKLLADKETDRLLGAHIIGPDAGTMIAELVLALEMGASSEDIALTCHAHPTLNEAVKEAALAVTGKTLNS
ncbi:MAG: dihydrolipoyl dehydrogenase [Rhodospirillaceae bacterium]|jgi:dihydrolipoamide dehydrogenase|nr:dihydrolipoyl dehydrogenase [Rhodospirillaceae bacterium]MBT4689644.1 dihydrolipoyl dehydrogenase [Rhodospirillaceae bacterium]MBT5079379.1 dihydrolipoyl dehydrogenase [Rhodospirillaceae bacterium]MBT5525854.1 dihydrolipoyl dehydrogenase [Rhodospirillaceae bacterium]MBT5880226.1 dihydrolipoyl dehydrogenase [Rhodospirillaceae bacterium]